MANECGIDFMMQVPFFRHDLGRAELDSIENVFKGTILTTGDYVAEFEKKFSAYVGTKNSLGVTSCTAGLHLSLMALGIGPGDEVITTPMTFVATLQAICYAGAKPVLVDVEADTGNIDVSKIEKAITPRTKAIMPVHLFGLMVDMKALRSLADKHSLKIIEDAAHCVEGSRDGIKPGQLGDTVCFSFFATKNMSCGEGGAIAMNDQELYKKLKLLRNHGMDKTSADRFKDGYQHWDVSVLGWKYNMGNIEAGILLPQLARVDDNLKKRHALADRYLTQLADLAPLVQTPATRPNTVHCRHLFPIWVPSEKRDQVIKELQNRGVSSVVNYRAVHLLDWFQKELKTHEGQFPVAERIGNQTISLPFYPNMPFEHVDYVVQCLKEILHK